MSTRWLAAFLACALAACGISAVGELATSDPAAADGGNGGSLDGSVNAEGGDAGDGGSTTNDAQPPCDAGTDAQIIFLPDDGGACPSGTTEETVQTAPQATADACSCGACTPTADPSCNAGAIAVEYSTSNSSCNQDSLAYANVPNETCTDFGLGSVDQAPYERWPARTPVGGACSAAAIPDPTKVTSTALRRCIATAPEAACIAPTGTQKKCIESTAPCGGDYPVTIDYGSAATVACSACACTRGATGCVVEHFSDGACTNLRYEQAMNGLCERTDDASNVQYFKVRATGLTCVSTPGAPTATLTNPRTLCCAP